MLLATPATALWNQRHVLAARQDELRQLIAAVGRPTDLCPYQWAQLMAFAREFQPDLILELGRGRGNSTCCFLEVADQLAPQPCKLVSLCLSDDWFTLTRPRVAALRPPGWFERGTFLTTDIGACDAAQLVAGAQRCFVFWDAHGFELAEWVLSELLPQLAGKPHVVAMHDLCDLRYCTPPRAYADCGLWTGENATDTGFWLGNVFSRVAQAISIVDFTTRNRLPLRSADESLHAELAGDPAKYTELQQLLGEDFIALNGHWFWFCLNEAPDTITFPVAKKQAAVALHLQPEQVLSVPSRPPLWRRAIGRARRHGRQLLNYLLPPPPPLPQVAVALPASAASRAEAGASARLPREIWLDVGAHLGEKTFAAASANPELRVYAFEPDLTTAAQLQGRLPNYFVLPYAVAETDGAAAFHRNRCAAASSLLGFDPAGLQAWQSDEPLHVEQTLTVPTIRLDTFLDRMQIVRVHYLKIDAQGTDLAVVRSLGQRIADVDCIDLEVQTSTAPLYQGASEKSAVLDFMTAAGFTLCNAEAQSAGQEENLRFIRSGGHTVLRKATAGAEAALPTDCFDTPEALAINEARLDHLEGLGLPLRGRRLLDVGCGVGHLASHFAERGCRVVCADGREGNIQSLRQRYPHLEAHVVDVERDSLGRFGRFDVVLCYGLLYHLENPLAALRHIASVCDDLLLVESVVTDHPDPLLVLVDETPTANQALQRIGCRPTPGYLVKALHQIGFPWVYVPCQPPAHADFEFTTKENLEYWRDGHLLRCSLIASRRALANDTLRLVTAEESVLARRESLQLAR